MQILNQFLITQLEQGGTVALLIDEAQNLHDEVLESLRLLSNLETSKEKLLQIVLVGQPELEAKLAQPALRQLKQRIATRYRLDRLKDRDIEPFIRHRLLTAGYQGPGLFTPDAFQRIIVYAKGIPRIINLICDNALLVAYGLSKKEVSAEIVDEVAIDLELTDERPQLRGRPPYMRTLPPEDEDLHVPIPRAMPQQGLGVQGEKAAVRREETPFMPQPGRKRLAFAFAVVILLVLLLGSVGIVVSSQDIRDDLKTRIAGLGPKVETLLGIAKKRIALLVGSPDLPFHESVLDVFPRGQENELLTGGDGDEEHSHERALENSPLEEQQEAVVHRQKIVRERGALPPVHEEGQEGFVTTNGLSSQSGTVSPQLETQREKPQGFKTEVSTPDTKMTLTGKRFVIIRQGATISETISDIYGGYNILALDIVKDMNPQVKNLDIIVAGKAVWFPALTRKTLLRKQSDNSYRLIVAAFRTIATAERFAQTVRSKGYTVAVHHRTLSDSISSYRVEIAGLLSEEEVDQAWNLVDIGNVLSTDPILSQGTRSDPYQLSPSQPLETEL